MELSTVHAGVPPHSQWLPRYEEQIAGLSARCPELGRVLRAHAAARSRLLSAYSHGARLRGLEQLLCRLAEIEAAMRERAVAPQVCDLIGRARGAFGVAIEATFSGLCQVSNNAMREVMEIECLLWDFAIRPAGMAEWSTATRRELKRRWQPRHLRDRYQRWAREHGRDVPVSDADYDAHSAALHVGPHRLPLHESDGLGHDQHAWAIDGCFWEMFYHAKGLLTGIVALAHAATPEDRAWADSTNMCDFEEACRRTSGMRQAVISIMDPGCADPGRAATGTPP